MTGNVEGFVIKLRHKTKRYILSYRSDRTVGGLINQLQEETGCSCSIRSMGKTVINVHQNLMREISSSYIEHLQ